MKVENEDLIQLRTLLQKYSVYHSKLNAIENEIDTVDKKRESLLLEVSSIKDAIEQTGIEENTFKEYMINKYGTFDIYAIINSL